MKTFILLALFAAAHQAWACKCDPRDLERLQKDPVSAATVLFAEAHVKADSQFLQVTHAWEAGAKNIDLEVRTSCRVPLKDNKRYLVLAAVKGSYRRCSTHFLELAGSSAQLKKLLARRPQQLQPHPVWLTCQQDAECVLTKNLCGGEVAVSKSHLVNMQAFVKENAPRVNCIMQESRLKLAPVCDDGLCLAKPDQL